VVVCLEGVCLAENIVRRSAQLAAASLKADALRERPDTAQPCPALAAHPLKSLVATAEIVSVV
jgi:hypothetical protein